MRRTKQQKGMKFSVVLLILSSSICASAQVDRAKTDRKKIIAALHKCSTKASTSDCEVAAEQAIDLFHRGDKQILASLLDLGLKSDGDLAELIGSFLGEDVLWKNPRLFLNAIVSRPRRQQEELSFSAGAMDGSGMPKEILRGVRSNLRRMSRQQNEPLAAIARLCLSRVEAANRAARN
ncbi:MAG: hypothetical protein DMF61_23980 [Blastocatellia bacterium AA13]|nr:MAG: hypothetical protein DMF61_23980 [Blastocatellia bacterium AA13]